MFLPSGSSKYDPIGIDLIDLDKFLQTLNEDLFTGYCTFKTKKCDIILLFERGELQRAFYPCNGSTLLSGSVVIQKCITAQTVETVGLSPAQVNMMCRLLFCVPRYQNVSTEFTDFKTFLVALEDEKFTGYIEINIDGSIHYLSLKKGGPRAAHYYSGNELISGAEALESIFSNIRRGATINVYPLKGLSLADPFRDISHKLFSVYSELKGPILTKKFWKNLSRCTRDTPYVTVGNGEFILENFPADPRVQEKILIPILQCEIGLYSAELGKKQVKKVYTHMVERLDSPLKEIFGGIL